MSDPTWLAHARTHIGLKEIPGKSNNPTIMSWAKEMGVAYPNDEVAWCGLFVGHTMHHTLPKESLPANILGSRNWAKFGVKCVPVLGAVLVFWRGSLAGWQGHVGYYVGEDSTHFYVLGGNQNNSVSITKIEKRRLIDARWPVTAKTVGQKVFIKDGKIPVTTNEA